MIIFLLQDNDDNGQDKYRFIFIFITDPREYHYWQLQIKVNR